MISIKKIQEAKTENQLIMGIHTTVLETIIQFKIYGEKKRQYTRQNKQSLKLD